MVRSIRIIAVGKNASMFREAEREYVSRIGRYSKIDIIEVREDGSKSDSEIIKKEGDAIIKKIDELPDTFSKVYALDINGSMYDSVSFSKDVEDNNIVFLIGGSLGLSQEVKKKAHKLISISRMTFTHQLARVILLEQIYRAFTIINGEKYHK